MASYAFSTLPNTLSALADDDVLGVDDVSANETKGITAASLFASPRPIGATNPTSGAFTTLSAGGDATLAKNLSMAVCADSATGVLLKGGSRYLHDFAPSGATGKNVFLGDSAGNYSMAISAGSYECSHNTAAGASALTALTTGYRNTAIGAEALTAATTATENTAVGYNCLRSLTTGAGNTAIGKTSQYSNTAAFNNTSVGIGSLYSTTSGGYNTAVGAYAMYDNTTGAYATALGYYALGDQTSGANNAAVGMYALRSLTTASYCTAVGVDALRYLTTASNNTALGFYALRNLTGAGNTAVGAEAGEGASGATAANCTLIGYQAGTALTTGGSNICIGSGAGDNLTTGSGNIIIGTSLSAPAASTSNQLNIGDAVQADLSTGIVSMPDVYSHDMAGETMRDLQINDSGELGYDSSTRRKKVNIAPLGDTAWLHDLRPVVHESVTQVAAGRRRPLYGLVAEQVEAVNPLLVFRDRLGRPAGVHYGKMLIVPMLAEIQRLHRRITEIEGRLS